MMTKDTITLKQVRSVMEYLANKQGCCLTEVEIAPVQDEIGKGSNGTVGAYVKQVKLEHINAKEYDRANISTQLKSAIKEEIDRFADNTRDNVAEQINVLDNLNIELCGKINDANEIISNLQDSLKAKQDEADKKIRHQSEELVKTVEKLEAQKQTNDQQDTDLETCRNELTGANTEIVKITKRVGALEADVITARQSTAEAANKLNDAIAKREEAERKALLAEKDSDHQQKTIDLLTKQTEKLEQQNDDLKTKVCELSAVNDKLHEKLEEANLNRINDLKKARAEENNEMDAEEISEGETSQTPKKGTKAN